ncbi:MAG: hypothetical protein P8179_01270 [Candidatus Thiodiazotropha sp.]|jgi:hypothetical protein
MKKRLEKLGINEFSNTQYNFKPKDIILIDNKVSVGALIEIKTRVPKDGLEDISIYIKINQEWFMAFDACFKNGKLCGSVKTDELIGKYNFNTIELIYNEGDPHECFYYTTEHDDSLKMLDELVKLIAPIELDNKEIIEVKEVEDSSPYAPFEALTLFRDHLLKAVQDISSYKEVEKIAVKYLEEQGEEFRAYLMADSDRRLDDYSGFWKEDLSKHEIWNEVENILFEHFPYDTVGLIDDLESIHTCMG